MAPAELLRRPAGNPPERFSASHGVKIGRMAHVVGIAWEAPTAAPPAAPCARAKSVASQQD